MINQCVWLDKRERNRVERSSQHNLIDFTIDVEYAQGDIDSVVGDREWIYYGRAKLIQDREDRAQWWVDAKSCYDDLNLSRTGPITPNQVGYYKWEFPWLDNLPDLITQLPYKFIFKGAPCIFFVQEPPPGRGNALFALDSRGRAHPARTSHRIPTVATTSRFLLSATKLKYHRQPQNLVSVWPFDTEHPTVLDQVNWLREATPALAHAGVTAGSR